MTQTQADIKTVFTIYYAALGVELLKLSESITDLDERLATVLLPDDIDIPLPEFEGGGSFHDVDFSLTTAIEVVKYFQMMVDKLNARFDETRVLPVPTFKIGD